MLRNYVYDIDKNEMCEADANSIILSDYVEPTFYDQFEFHEYHQRFVDEVFLLCIKSRDKIIGYCYLGSRENILKAPYSSPFALIHLKENFKVSDACLFVEGIKKFANKKDFYNVYFTLPPEIYNAELVSTLSASLFSEGFKVKSIEINNYFDLTKYSDLETHLKQSPHKVRKNYKRALKNELKFEEVEIEDFELAYDVIKVNREQMGYPLKISIHQMQDLINMDSLKVRSFVVRQQEKPIAAAIIFDVTKETSQVIYWGDILEYRNERPMDLLTLQIFDTYKKLGKKYLDIGPSSEDGVINVGLADFKKSIGCDTNIKAVFVYEAI